MTEQVPYSPPSKEEILLQDFLGWCSKQHGVVLTDISRPDINNRTNYRFVSHSKMVSEYLERNK